MCCLADAKTTYRHSYQWMKNSHTRVNHRRHHDRCECAEDGKRARHEACLIWESTRNRELDADAKGNPQDHEDISTLTAILCQCRSECSRRAKTKAKHGKDARIKSSEKVKDDDRRKCYHCREASRAKSRSRTRLEGPGRCRVRNQ